MRKGVLQHIRHCSVCQRNKSNTNRIRWFASAIPDSWQTRERIRVDLITQLPPTKAVNSMIVIFVDRRNKMVFFAAVLTTFSAHDGARLYLQTIIRAQGM